MIDLRSDTTTLPTAAMYAAMQSAQLGDDLLGDDSDVRRLEAVAAERLGKAAGLFVPSGTMGNLIALQCWTQHGDAVAMESLAHTYMLEVAGLSAVAGCMAVRIPGTLGVIAADDFEREFTAPFREEVPIKLLWIENTHNLAGGTVTNSAQMQALAAVARQHGASVHVDGARIFNAAVAQGVEVRELTRDADSVMFCLSKGLCCPVGSMLVGPRPMIDRARHLRARLGGAMRQSGLLAACGLVALDTLVDRLADDHANARRLAERLATVDGLALDLATVQTNLVFFNVTKPGLTAIELVQRCAARGVRFFNLGSDRIRLVTHHDVSRAQCAEAAEIIATEVTT